jgi:tetratricopeptide (TPR) repeat protein
MEAINEYDKAIKIDPKYVDAYNNKGNALSDLGRIEEAIIEYDEAIKIDPKFVLCVQRQRQCLK